MQVQKPQNLQRRNWPDKGYVLASENDKSLWPYKDRSAFLDWPQKQGGRSRYHSPRLLEEVI